VAPQLKPCRRCGTISPRRIQPGDAYCGSCAGKVRREMIGSGYLQTLPIDPGAEPSPRDSELRDEWLMLNRAYNRRGLR
jgi:hypothetical protein